MHGANRLASSSLLEGVTWGYLAAENILKSYEKVNIYPDSKIRNWHSLSTTETELALIEQDWLTLKQTMWNYVGIIRTDARIVRANAMFRELWDEIQRFYRNAPLRDELIGLRNAVEVGYMVLKASQINKESVGCFYKKD